MSQQLPPIPSSPVPNSNKKGFAIAGLVLGVVNLCGWIIPICGGPLAIIGLVLSFLGIKSPGKGMAIAGIVLSGLALLLTIGNVIFGAVIGSGDVFNQIQSALNTTGYY